VNAPPCLNCHVVMRCHRTGAFLELMAADQGYQIWCADVFKCLSCGATVAVGFADKPFAQSFEVTYEEERKRCRPIRYWSTRRDKDKWQGEFLAAAAAEKALK
jgi:hypothetical protein